jgi:predicted NUDIX family NTP pyrophosphohydrolase
MAGHSRTSAGLLLFRSGSAGLEVFLAHPGGPFWARRDAGAWSIPKGEPEPGEDLESAARREFHEETGLRPVGRLHALGSVRLKSGKVVHAWACRGDADPDAVHSNETSAEWPRHSGRVIRFPEVDRCAWFDLDTARQKLNPAQTAFLDRLEHLAGRDASDAPGD